MSIVLVFILLFVFLGSLNKCMIGVGHEIGGLCYSNLAPIFPPPLHRQISVPYLFQVALSTWSPISIHFEASSWSLGYVYSLSRNHVSLAYTIVSFFVQVGWFGSLTQLNQYSNVRGPFHTRKHGYGYKHRYGYGMMTWKFLEKQELVWKGYIY